MWLIQTTAGKFFSQIENQTLLDAANKVGIVIPYSCKSGRCSSCKCKVISGHSQATVDEFGLSPEEKADGWILGCVRTATSDLLIEADDLNGITIPEVKTLPARISSLEKLAPDVLGVKLRLPPSSVFNFLPGQYIDVIGAGGIRRSYSLANSISDDRELELHIRAVEGGGMSQYWFAQAKVNDLLRLNGPLGTFFLRETEGLDLIFLATGTGIAPVKAILESMPAMGAERQPRSVTVLWGGRTPEDMYMDLLSIPVKLCVVQVLSRAGSNWIGARGHVQQVLLSIQSDLSKSVVYACGSARMIQSAKVSLTAAGLPVNRFYSDAFVCSSPN